MKLSEYLARHGISREDFARRIRRSPEAVRLYLIGERTPSRATMKAVIAATKGAVRPNDFYPEYLHKSNSE